MKRIRIIIILTAISVGIWAKGPMAESYTQDDFNKFIESSEVVKTISRNFVIPRNMYRYGIFCKYNLAEITEYLGLTVDEFEQQYNRWREDAYSEQGGFADKILINISDGGSLHYPKPRNFFGPLDSKGHILSDEEYARFSYLLPDDPTWEVGFTFNKKDNLLLIHTQFGEGAKEGDENHVLIALNNKGRMVNFDITLSLTHDTYGADVQLDGMKCVGKLTLTSDDAFQATKGKQRFKINMHDVLKCFSAKTITPYNIGTYVMRDLENRLLTDYGTYSDSENTVFLSAEGLDYDSDKNKRNCMFSLNNITGEFEVSYSAMAFAGGERVFIPIFLGDGKEYYELNLNLQLGSPDDILPDLNIVSTQQLEARLMVTSGLETVNVPDVWYYNLVKTPVDISLLEELLGTTNPSLYAESIKDGEVVYTNAYSLSNGYWFTPLGETSYATSYNMRAIFGLFYSDGTIKWTETDLFENKHVGDTYKANIFFVNPDNKKAVKYELSICFVEDYPISDIEKALVYQLPYRKDDTETTAIRSIEVLPNISHPVYNLQGQLLHRFQPGLNIVDGKKILVK